MAYIKKKRTVITIINSFVAETAENMLENLMDY